MLWLLEIAQYVPARANADRRICKVLFMGENLPSAQNALPQYRPEERVCKPVNFPFCAPVGNLSGFGIFLCAAGVFCYAVVPLRQILRCAGLGVFLEGEISVTAQEMIDSLPTALMQDERILSAGERELLANILRHARNQSVSGSKVAETMARAIGETIAQRAFSVLGEGILRALEAQPGSPVELLEGVRLGTGPLPVPSPPSPLKPGPHPPSPSPPTSPSGISARRQHGVASLSGTDPSAAVSVSRPECGGVGILESQEILPAQCVVFDEFLVPAELERLMRFALEHEADFRISEVLSPGVKGGTIDHEHRRSRVLSEPGEEINPLVGRVKAALPRVVTKLGLAAFPVAQVEAQITASNHGDFFRWHSDNAQEEIASREITFVYFFHREPKRFHGGELRIYDSLPYHGTYVPTTNYRAVAPRQNQIVFFRSSLAHEITPVECPSGEFGDSRFTVNGWFHR